MGDESGQNGYIIVEYLKMVTVKNHPFWIRGACEEASAGDLKQPAAGWNPYEDISA
jgi:hypothetical protein